MNIWDNGEFWARAYFKALKPTQTGGWDDCALPLNVDGVEHKFYVTRVSNKTSLAEVNYYKGYIDSGELTASYIIDGKFEAKVTFYFSRYEATHDKRLGKAFGYLPFTVVDCKIIDYDLTLFGETTQEEVDHLMLMVLLQGDVYD